MTDEMIDHLGDIEKENALRCDKCERIIDGTPETCYCYKDNCYCLECQEKIDAYLDARIDEKK